MYNFAIEKVFSAIKKNREKIQFEILIKSKRIEFKSDLKLQNYNNIFCKQLRRFISSIKKTSVTN